MKRDIFIDNLRGICMIAMILIHTSYFYISEPLVYTLWNICQFAVPGFVFCSFYLFFKREPSFQKNSFLPYFIKRLKRLLLPYYIFALFYLVITAIFHRSNLSTAYVLKSVFLLGGIDINWLILLFIYLTLISIGFIYFKKINMLWYGFFLISFISSIFFLQGNAHIDYRYTMWLPWSLVLYFTYFFVTNKKRTQFIVTSFLAFVTLFIVTRVYLDTHHHSLSFIDNKYPPNLYYLVYGLAIIVILYYCSLAHLFRPIHFVTTFFSKYSYSIYFIHYIVLTILTNYIKQFNITWYELFFSVLGISVIIQLVISIMQKKQLVLPEA